MNRDVRELYKLYEQTFSFGASQPGQTAFSGNTQPSIYNIKAPGDQDNGLAKDFYNKWRAFEESNPWVAVGIQIVDPTTVTGWPDVYDSGKELMNVDFNNNTRVAWHTAKFMFYLICLIPWWVPFAGWAGKVFQFLKTGSKVEPKVAVTAVDTGLKYLKSPAGIRLMQKALEKCGANPDQIAKIIDSVMKADTYKLAEDILKIGKVDTNTFKEGLEQASKEAAEKSKGVLPKGATDEALLKVQKLVGTLPNDPLFADPNNIGLIAKIKYWLGSKGGKGTIEEAIEYLRKGDYSNLDDSSREVLNQILSKYKINEEAFTGAIRAIYRTETDKAIDDIIVSTAKSVDDAADVGAKAGAEATEAGARVIDDIAAENKNAIDFLNQAQQGTLPVNAQKLGDKVLKKGGADLKSALDKINKRRVAAAGGTATLKILTRGERKALEKAATELGENGVTNIIKRVVKGSVPLVLLKGIIAVKLARGLFNWLGRQYEKGEQYRPTAPGTVTNKIIGTSAYVPQGSTAANPLGRKGPGALNAISTTNQYQYKPVKWWSTQ